MSELLTAYQRLAKIWTTNEQNTRHEEVEPQLNYVTRENCLLEELIR